MNSFYKRFCDLCAQSNKSASGVAVAIGLSNAAASGWKKGKMPNDTTLAKLADYFGVTVEDLLADNEKKPTSLSGSELSPAQQELWDMIAQGDLSEEELGYIVALMKARKKP